MKQCDLYKKIRHSVKCGNVKAFKTLIDSCPELINVWNISNFVSFNAIFKHGIHAPELSKYAFYKAQEEILYYIINNKDYDPFLLDKKGYKQGVNALAISCMFGFPKTVKKLLQLGVNPDDISRHHSTPAALNFLPLYASTENAYKCLSIVLEHGIRCIDDPDMFSRNCPALLTMFVRYNNIPCIKLLLSHGASTKGWREWDMWYIGYSTAEANIHKAAREKYLDHPHRFIPTWTIFSQKRYPNEFREIAFLALVTMSRLNKTKDTKICPDMRKLLISYIADEWKNQ